MISTHRIEWIDTLRGFGIIMVFLGHTTLINKIADHYIFSFHMPLFFFIAGLFFKTTDASGGFQKFLLNRLRVRMIPYISFGLLTYCIWLLPFLLRRYGIYQGSTPIPDSLYCKPLTDFLYGDPDNSLLWFLACLFVTEIIFYFIYSRTKTKHTMIFALLIFALLGYVDAMYIPIRFPFSINIAFSAVVFYGLGFLLRGFLFDHNFGLGSAFVCLIIGIIIAFINDRADMNFRTYGNPVLFYTSSLLSIYAYICFFKRAPSNKFISYIGQNSLIFFLLQGIGFSVVNIFAYLVLRARPNSMEPNLLYAFSYVFLSLLVLFPAAYIINSRIPIITGKSRGRERQDQVQAAQEII